MLLIDCYNLLHTTMPEPLAGLDEARLVELVAAGPWQRAMIVCDGVPKPHAPVSLSQGEVELVYAGSTRSADDVIRDAIDCDSAPRRLIVVSNDRQIQKAAVRRRAQALSCEAFIGLLARLAVSTPAPRSTPLPTDADYWLREFGIKDA